MANGIFRAKRLKLYHLTFPGNFFSLSIYPTARDIYSRDEIYERKHARQSHNTSDVWVEKLKTGVVALIIVWDFSWLIQLIKRQFWAERSIVVNSLWMYSCQCLHGRVSRLCNWKHCNLLKPTDMLCVQSLFHNLSTVTQWKILLTLEYYKWQILYIKGYILYDKGQIIFVGSIYGFTDERYN